MCRLVNASIRPCMRRDPQQLEFVHTHIHIYIYIYSCNDIEVTAAPTHRMDQTRLSFLGNQVVMVDPREKLSS